MPCRWLILAYVAYVAICGIGGIRSISYVRRAQRQGSVHIRTHTTSGQNIVRRQASGLCHARFHIGTQQRQAVQHPVLPDDRQQTSGCINIRFLRRCCIFTHQLNLVNEMLNFVSSAFLARLTAKSVPNCANNCSKCVGKC